MDDASVRRLARRLLPLLLLPGGCASKQMLESRRLATGLSAPVEGTSYYLPKKLVRIEVWGFLPEKPVAEEEEAAATVEPGALPTPRHVVLEPKPKYFATHADGDAGEVVTPDLRHQYVIVPNWDTASHDTVDVEMTKDGLLTHVCGTAVDERANVFQGVLDIATMLATGVPAKTRALKYDERPRIVARYELDPVDPVDLARVRKELQGFGITFTLERQSDCPVATSGAGCCTTCDSTQPGIYYRLPIPYRMSLKPAGVYRISPPQPPGTFTGEWDYLDGGSDWTVLLPNEAVCMFAPVSRAAFVTRKTELYFDRGMLTKVVTDKPSELLGFVKIPVDALSTILAIPAELLTLRIKKAGDEADLAAKRKAAAEGEKQLLDAQRDVLEAQMRLLEAQNAARRPR